MPEQKHGFRIVAAAASNTGDLIIEDSVGRPRLFVGSTGTLSQKPLNPDFVDALLRRDHWRTVRDDHWYSYDELREEFASN